MLLYCFSNEKLMNLLCAIERKQDDRFDNSVKPKRELRKIEIFLMKSIVQCTREWHININSKQWNQKNGEFLCRCIIICLNLLLWNPVWGCFFFSYREWEMSRNRGQYWIWLKKHKLMIQSYNGLYEQRTFSFLNYSHYIVVVGVLEPFDNEEIPKKEISQMHWKEAFFFWYFFFTLTINLLYMKIFYQNKRQDPRLWSNDLIPYQFSHTSPS